MKLLLFCCSCGKARAQKVFLWRTPSVHTAFELWILIQCFIPRKGQCLYSSHQQRRQVPRDLTRHVIDLKIKYMVWRWMCHLEPNITFHRYASVAKGRSAKEEKIISTPYNLTAAPIHVLNSGQCNGWNLLPIRRAAQVFSILQGDFVPILKKMALQYYMKSLHIIAGIKLLPKLGHGPRINLFLVSAAFKRCVKTSLHAL